MFAKLLKHEWKASAGTLGLMSLAAVVMGVVGGFILRTIMGYTASMEYDETVSALMTPLTLLLVFLGFAMAVCLGGINLVLMFRFYKSKFTDEGYLTFTLPVSSSQIFLSSLTNMLIWSLITAVVGIVAVGLLVGIGISGIPELDQFWKEFMNSFGYMEDVYDELFAQDSYAAYQLLSMVYTAISWLVSPALMMTCITLGAVLAKKHKLLAAVGVYYGLNMVISTVASMAEVFVVMDEYYMYDYSGVLPVVAVQIAVQLALGVGGYFLSTWLMDKKLNLP